MCLTSVLIYLCIDLLPLNLATSNSDIRNYGYSELDTKFGWSHINLMTFIFFYDERNTVRATRTMRYNLEIFDY